MSDQTQKEFANFANHNSLTARCSCHGDTILQIKHLASALGILFLRMIVLALVLAYLMSLIDYLHTIDVAPLLLPFSDLGQYKPTMEHAAGGSSVDNAWNNFLVLFDCSFPGYSRFGSGVGVIGGAFWTMHATPPSCRIQRIGVGIIGGAIIGFRLLLMISRSLSLAMFSTLAFSIGLTIYLINADKKIRISSLPLVQRN